MNIQQRLREVAQVEIITLVDNVVDLLLENTDNVKRAPRIRDGTLAPPLFAEHGFSAIVKVTDGDETHTILLDAGLSETTMLINADRLGIDFREIEAVIISHGHLDHIRALIPALGRLRPGIPIIIHPHAFAARIMRLPDGTEIHMAPLDPGALGRGGAKIVREQGPSLQANGMILVTGEIPHRTEFEFGLPFQYAIVGGVEQPDPLTIDDQSLVIKVREKGLVVLSGCAHAGIINTINYACELGGSNKVHAVVGGFHLSGPLYESITEATVAAMKEISPDFIVPSHCTGWKAIHELARQMSEAFVQNSVGTRLIFGSVPMAK